MKKIFFVIAIAMILFVCRAVSAAYDKTGFPTLEARKAISEVIDGIEYDSRTGIFRMTSGYFIPTIANPDPCFAAWLVTFDNNEHDPCLLDALKKVTNGGLMIRDGNSLKDANAASITAKIGDPCSYANGTFATKDDVNSLKIGRVATIFVAASNASVSEINHADYVCTGTTDGTTLNTAISALVTTIVDGNGVIQLSTGRFNLDARVALRSNLTINGCGITTEINAVNSLNDTMLSANFASGYAENITISNCVINGNYQNCNASTEMIRLKNCRNVTIRNVTFKDGNDVGIIILDLPITTCSYTHTGGTVERKLSNGTLNAFYGVKIGDKINAGKTTGGIIAGNYTVETVDDVNYKYVGLKTSPGLTGNGSTITSYMSSNHILIDNCYFYNISYGGVYAQNADYVTVNNCRGWKAFSSTEGSCISFVPDVTASRTTSCLNPKIIGGHYSNSIYRSGVYLKQCFHAVLEGVDASNNGLHGFELVDCNGISVTTCVASNNTSGAGIDINNCNDFTITNGDFGNDGNETQRYGINIEGASTNGVISSCKLYNNDSSSGDYAELEISNNSSKISLIGNEIHTNNAPYCIRDAAGGTGGYHLITTNRLSGGTTSAILLGHETDTCRANYSSNYIPEQWIQYWKNVSDVDVNAGSVVVRASDTNDCDFTTTTTTGDFNVIGVLVSTTTSNNYGPVMRQGKTVQLKVDGTTDIAVGNYISAFTVAEIGKKAASGDTVFAKALEAYATDDSNGVIDAIIIEPRYKP